MPTLLSLRQACDLPQQLPSPPPDADPDADGSGGREYPAASGLEDEIVLTVLSTGDWSSPSRCCHLNLEEGELLFHHHPLSVQLQR